MSAKPPLDTNSLGQLQLGRGAISWIIQQIELCASLGFLRPLGSLLWPSTYCPLITAWLRAHQFLHFFGLGRAFLVVICGFLCQTLLLQVCVAMLTPVYLYVKVCEYFDSINCTVSNNSVLLLVHINATSQYEIPPVFKSYLIRIISVSLGGRTGWRPKELFMAAFPNSVPYKSKENESALRRFPYMTFALKRRD